MSTCPVMTAENRCADRIERRDTAHDAAFSAMHAELQTALSLDARMFVQTPGWAKCAAPAAEVVADMLDSQGPLWLTLLDIARLAAQDGGELGLKARAWRSAIATAHADWHADDAAIQGELL